ncbi:hypothetical protein Agub_g3004 [Astrephomene gubernaculifera]|uniref:Protein kinase domain-containing protein n=1 Tax=Astrephomene gubernaculifera TaxID=47775 RepID=A0AAD3DK00_9CHLO|nr:hypothetical protein Agub_g3004 [Astrephomene gubernaculifera]
MQAPPGLRPEALRTRGGRLLHYKAQYKRHTEAKRACISVAASPREQQGRASPPSSRTSAQQDRGQQGRGGFTPADAELVSPRRAFESTDWFYSEAAQKEWVQAMQLDSLTPEMPQLLRDMGLRYDPERLAQVLGGRWPQVTARAVQVSTALGGFLASLARDRAVGAVEENMGRRAGQLRGLLGRLGPALVKIGQALSSRPDLLPRPYLEALSELQDRLPAFPHEIAMAVIEEELGRPVTEVFSEISERPVAAASLGQVYRARLRACGSYVAVKVQRPTIGESIAVDMLLLRRLAGVADARLPQVSQPLVPLVDEFAARLFAELDYVQEGHNCERFQQLYGNMPRVRTPKIYWDYTARRVLTMEWIEGVKLTDGAAMSAAGLNVVDFVDVGVECTLRQLLEQGYFHADPHPGNLLATRSGELVYLDFGMMSEAPQYARYAIMAHLVHLVNRDYEAMCRDYYALQFVEPCVDTSPLAPALAAFFDTGVLAAPVAQLNFKAIVDGLGEVLFKFPFRVPAYYALILRSLTVLEGLALQADPNYKLLARAYPYVARRLLTDPAPELRESFQELIIKDGQIRWGRFENLLQQGSRSSDWQPGQLWLLAEWLLAPGAEAGGLRAVLAEEVGRLLDAAAAEDVRSRIAEKTGSPSLAAALVPRQPAEEEARQRAQLLLAALAPPRTGPPGGEGLLGGLGEGLGSLKGSGPFGLPLPQDAQAAASRLSSLASSLGPRLAALAAQPGSGELLGGLAGHLGRRAAARAIKFAFGAQQALAGGGAEGRSGEGKGGEGGDEVAR